VTFPRTGPADLVLRRLTADLVVHSLLMAEIRASLRRPRSFGSTSRGSHIGLLPFVGAGIAGALMAFGLMGGFSGSSWSGAPSQNLLAGFFDAVRVGDQHACLMASPRGARDLANLLVRAGATTPAAEGCGTALANSSSKVRLAAIRPFLDVNRSSGGSNGGLSNQISWRQLPDGRYTVVAVSEHGADGWLVDTVRITASAP
jgi:hypothetical protein